MDIDEGSYAAIACRLLQGGLPYRDAVENKVPGVFYIYRTVFGLFGRYNMVALHLTVALFALGTALACGAISRRLASSEAAGFWAALLYTVFSTTYYPKMLAGNTEMFLVLPASLGMLALVEAGRRRWLYLVAGACAGVALLLKQVAGGLIAAMMADRTWSALRTRRLGRGLVELLLLALGAAAVLITAAALLRRAGVFDDAVFWTWTYVFRHYIPSGNRDHGFVFNLATNFVPFLLTVSPLVLLGARVRPAQAAPIWWWLASMTCAALVGGRMYGHYFLMMLPPLAVLGGIGAAGWLSGPNQAARRRLLVGASAFVAVGFFVYACLFEAATESLLTPKPDYRQAGAWVREHTRSDERVFVWGWFPPLYQAADRCPSTRFVYTHILSGSASSGGEARGHVVPEAWEMLLGDLEREPPAYVLDTSHGDYSYAHAAIERFPRLWQFLSARYRLETELAGVRIYRRNDR
jgi:hypothetical protein